MTRARDVSTPTALVLLNTTSFTAQSSVSFNNVFTSTYDNYRILFHAFAASANSVITLRLRLSGTDTTTNYRSERDVGYQSSPSAAANVSGTDDMYIGNVISTQSETGVTVFDIFSPALARKTVVSGTAGLAENSTDQLTMSFYNVQTDATAFDGFTIGAGGTLTGTIRVYGYRN
jgi:hypothetical protein